MNNIVLLGKQEMHSILVRNTINRAKTHPFKFNNKAPKHM